MLSKKQSEFDPTSTLLAGDVGVETLVDSSQVLKIKLKAPKEARLRHGVVVDIFPVGSVLCPLLAVRKYIQALPVVLADDKPFFRRLDGLSYTGVAFNADLRKLLK